MIYLACEKDEMRSSRVNGRGHELFTGDEEVPGIPSEFEGCDTK